MGFSGGASGKEPACKCRRHKRRGFDPWTGKIPWKRHGNPLKYSCAENHIDRGAWRPKSIGSQRVRHERMKIDLKVTENKDGEGNGDPTPVLLPGKSHGRRNLVGCSPWGREESDTTERLHFHVSLSCTGEGNGNPLQCSYLENPRDGGAWWAAVYGVAQSRTRLK